MFKILLLICLFYIILNIKTNINSICENNFFSFNKERNKNEVLIIEKKRVHGECIPGYIKYLLDLGYHNIDVLMNDRLYGLHTLNLSIFNGNVNELVYPGNKIDDIIFKHNICDFYQICFFNTIYSFDINKFHFNNSKQLFLAHSVPEIKPKLLTMGNAIVIKKFNESQEKVYEVNPHYFGFYDYHKKNKITHFVTAGNYNNNRKNFNLLIKSVEFLEKLNKKDFHLTIIGDGKKPILSDKIKNFITFTGRIPYDTMYNIISKCDFFLPLLDPIFHLKYAKTLTSGSFQLSYGLNIPILIHSFFAEVYNFDNGNSIIYEDDEDFIDKLVDVIEMNEETYANIKINLEKKAKKIYKDSLSNLKEAIFNLY